MADMFLLNNEVLASQIIYFQWERISGYVRINAANRPFSTKYVLLGFQLTSTWICGIGLYTCMFVYKTKFSRSPVSEYAELYHV